MHLDIILPAFGDLHTLQGIEPGGLGIVLELQMYQVAPVLAFDLSHVALHDGLPLVDDHDILAQFLGLL